LKYKTRTELYRRPNFFQFQTDAGGVFLRCVDSTCLVVEGASRETYDKINGAIGWEPAPASSTSSAAAGIAQIDARRSISSAAPD
jgi:hypothetical protein